VLHVLPHCFAQQCFQGSALEAPLLAGCLTAVFCFLPLPRCCRRLMQMLWGRGEPVIVRGLAGRMGWTPEGMARVCKDGDK
jgi:hypothetical protein